MSYQGRTHNISATGENKHCLCLKRKTTQRRNNLDFLYTMILLAHTEHSHSHPLDRILHVVVSAPLGHTGLCSLRGGL